MAADVYGLIPDVDSLGRPGQRAKFLQWNSDPLGNDARNVAAVNPMLQRVIARARADNPDLSFVVGSGLRSAQNQDLAKQWGWSKVGSQDGGDAAVHMSGRAVDLWGLNDQGQVQFVPAQQQRIAQAVKASAAAENVPLTWGGDFRTFKDAPHFELAGPHSAEGTGGSPPVSNPAIGPPAPPASIIDMLARNIAGIESPGWRNPYAAIGPNVAATADHPAGNAVGKYQVMSYNVGPWTQAALGRTMTPPEFKADPNAQEAVFRDQMTRGLQTYSPADVASIWFTGKPAAQAGGAAHDVLGTTNASYVARATRGIPNASSVLGTSLASTPVSYPSTAMAQPAPSPSLTAPAGTAPALASPPGGIGSDYVAGHRMPPTSVVGPTGGPGGTSVPLSATASNILPGFSTQQASDAFSKGVGALDKGLGFGGGASGGASGGAPAAPAPPPMQPLPGRNVSPLLGGSPGMPSPFMAQQQLASLINAPAPAWGSNVPGAASPFARAGLQGGGLPPDAQAQLMRLAMMNQGQNYGTTLGSMPMRPIDYYGEWT